jgi:hypothetical protein
MSTTHKVDDDPTLATTTCSFKAAHVTSIFQSAGAGLLLKTTYMRDNFSSQLIMFISPSFVAAKMMIWIDSEYA